MTLNANGNGFLKQAALLTGIVIGVLTLAVTILVPLYASNSPVRSQVQANADAADTDRLDDQQALEALSRQNARTIVLLREALVASCERGNDLRRELRVVVRHHPDLRSRSELRNVECDDVIP